MERATAAELLADVWLRRGVKEGIATFEEQLTNATQQERTWGKLRPWQQSFSEEEASLMRLAVEQAVRGAVLGLAIYFDGAVGYEDAEDTVGELTIALRTYPNLEEAGTTLPESTIMVCPTEHGEDVHDILLARFDEEDARR